MLRFLLRNRSLVVGFAALLMPVLYFLANDKPHRERNLLDRLIVNTSMPVHWAVEGGYTFYRGFVDRRRQRFRLVEDNEALRRENQRLKWALAARSEQDQELRRLQLLLGLAGTVDGYDRVAGRVVAISPNPNFRSIRIGAGSRQGLSEGQAVVSPDGVVGRVVSVEPFSADVVLVSDPNHSISTLNQRSRVRARVRGSSDPGLLRFEHLPRDVDVAPGDQLVTSGLGGVFPSGLPVGVVSTIEHDEVSVHQEGLVQWAVPVEALQEVLVLVPEEGR